MLRLVEGDFFMKRLLSVILVLCMVLGLATPAGSGLLTEIKANTNAALNNIGAAERKTESASEGSAGFDQAIRDLYDHSMSAEDEEVIASAQKMDSDFRVIENKLGNEADNLIDYLKYYEAEKSRYIAGDAADHTAFSVSIVSEWERQGEYTSFVMPADDMIRTLVPRIKVTGCSFEDGTADLDIYEWMTVGYASDSDSKMNAAAYGYNFSLQVGRDNRGNWQIASISDTDQNFDWMEEEAQSAAQAAQTDTDDLRVISEDGSLEMMAASAATTYNYNVSSAIAYADKYCINYNSSYNSYKGRGGDCANFVSQCLYAGGFKQDSVWYRHSVAWINVMKQIAHFKQYGSFLNANNGNLIKGNPIYFDWNGDGVYDHATICVGRNNSGTAILDSHTKDLYHATWTNWSFKKAGTIQLRTSGTASSTSSDGGTFKTDSTGKYYVYPDGARVKGCFKTIDGNRYYFNNSGYVVKGLHKIGDYFYFFNTSSGVMKTGWVTYNGHKYYFGSNGAGYTEWEEIGGKTYYFKPTTCIMATGFYTVKTKKHYFGTDGVERFGWITVNGNTYHLDEYGVVQNGWQTIGGKKYYFNAKGIMVKGYIKIGSTIHSFSDKGVYLGKVTAEGVTYQEASTYGLAQAQTTTTESSTSGKTGWVRKNGHWYYYKKGIMQTGWLKIGNQQRTFYLGTDGVMRTGWQIIGSSKYHFTAEGVMQTGWITYNNNKYYLQSNGKMKTGWLKDHGAWYYLLKNGRMKTGWLKLGNTYYYLQKNGRMKTGWLKDTDGHWYYMNSDGAMVTGRKTIGGVSYYFNKYGALVE